MSCLYVVEVGDDRIKVGVSGAPEQRIARHRSIAAAHGSVTGRHWITPPITRGRTECEGALVSFCRARATAQYGNEYFSGVAFEDAARRAMEAAGHTPVDLYRRAKAAGRGGASVVPDVARFLHVDRSVIEQLVAAGELSVRRFGRRTPNVTTASLMAWLLTEPDLFALAAEAAS